MFLYVFLGLLSIQNFCMAYSMIVGRGVLTPLFYEYPHLLYCLPHSPFSNFVQPLPPSLLFLWLNGWLCHIWYVILMILWIYTCRVLVGPSWCVFCARSCQVYLGLIHVVFCWYSDLISHTQVHTHTHKATHHTQGPRDWHTHIIILYIYTTCFVLTTAIFITMNNSQISKIYFPQYIFFSKIIHL